MADDDEDRAAVVPVRVGSRTGPAWIVAATATAVAIVTFAFGYRLGNAPPAATPTPRPTLAPTLAPPAPTPAAVAVPDIAQFVSRRLRGAVSAAGGPIIGTWVVCTIDTEPHCQPLDHQPLDRSYDSLSFRFGPEEWARLAPEGVAGDVIVVAVPLVGRAAEAILVTIDGDFNPIDSLALMTVNADQQGVYFMDLGALTPGRYVVAVGNLAERQGSFGGLGLTFGLDSYFAGIEVTPTAIP
jgi:hypothetical protein